MSVNPHDDYEKLAKLLYPSIEASGNVYYGQTRKLTLDELFDKNNDGFHSYIESERIEDENADYGYVYKSYFCWKVGPLNGRVEFNPNENHYSDNIWNQFPNKTAFTIKKQYDTGIDYKLYNFDKYEYSIDERSLPYLDRVYNYYSIFAKYKLIINTTSKSEIINSGNYTIYENDISAEFCDISLTNNRSPIDINETYKADRSFYVAKEGNDWYIYVHITEDTVRETSIADDNSLTFKAVGQVSIALVLYNGTNSDASNLDYKYKKNSSTWSPYTLKTYDQDPTYITLNNGDILRFNLNGDKQRVQWYSKTNHNGCYVQFIITGDGYVEAFGNICSMGQIASAIGRVYSSFEFYRLFYQCDKLIQAPDLQIGDITPYMCYETFSECISLQSPPVLEYNLSEYCYAWMFSGCTSLKIAPNLDSTELKEGCYQQMFTGCTSLQKSPVLPSPTLVDYCYEYMFYECSSLYEITVLAEHLPDPDITRATFAWVSYVGANIEKSPVFYCKKDAGWINDSFSGGYAPYGWKLVEINSYSQKCNETRFITYGSNSYNNGRGDITKKSTLVNMEKSFDERNRHQMNTYNADGSFNQEIWGYKIFNSPVQFRNGIYGEQYIVSECTNSTDKIKAVVSDIQNYTSNPKVVVIEPDSVKSSCYKSNNTSVTLSSAEFSDISDTIPKSDIFNMYGVTPTVSYDDLWVVGSTQDSSNTVCVSAATHTNKVSEISINSKTFPIVYVNRDLDMEGEPEFESNGITLYHNTHSEIHISSKADYTANLIVSSRTSELAGDSASSIIMQSKSNHIPHLYSDIILPNCYIVVYEDTYRYDKRNFIIALSTISNEPQEDAIAKVSSNNDIYLLPPGVSKQTVASSENKSVDELTFIECVCSDEQITSILHNHSVGYNIRLINDSYIGTSSTPYNEIHTNNMYAANMSINGATYLENIPSTAFCVEYTLSPITDEDKDAFYDLGNDTTLLRFLHQDIDIGTAKHIVLKTSNNIHCLFSLDGDDSSTGNHYVSFNYTDTTPTTVVNSAIPIYDDINESYGCIFTNAFSKYTHGEYRSLDGQYSYKLKYATYYNGHNNSQINLENCYIYMSQYNKIVVVDTNSSKLYFSDINSIHKVPTYEVGTGTVIYGAIGLDVIFQTEVNSVFNTIRWIRHTDRNNIYLEATNGRCIRIHREAGSWSCEEIKNILGLSEISEFTYDITKYSSVVKRQYTTSGNKTWYLLMTRVKHGIYYIDSDSAILAADECHGSIEDMSYNGFGE